MKALFNAGMLSQTLVRAIHAAGCSPDAVVQSVQAAQGRMQLDHSVDRPGTFRYSHKNEFVTGTERTERTYVAQGEIALQLCALNAGLLKLERAFGAFSMEVPERFTEWLGKHKVKLPVKPEVAKPEVASK